MHEVVLWLQLQGFINMKEWKKLQMSYIKKKKWTTNSSYYTTNQTNVHIF